ncbi:MAG: HNH endonuclease signature motif containing protein [Nitrospirota bacterium]
MPPKKQIEGVWTKAKPIRGQNPDTWRKDAEGNKIRKASYGTLGQYGWEVDHIKPIAKGGTDDPRNLQALHWEENRAKSDEY